MGTASNRYTTKQARALGFASGLEGKVVDQLKKINRDYEYESPNCKFDYTTSVRGGGLQNKKGEAVELPDGCKIVQWHEYTCDFRIISAGGNPIYLETKGFFKPKDRAKHQSLKRMYPDLDLRIIFESDGKVSHQTRYSQWAEKWGYRYHVLTRQEKKEGRLIPQDWLDE